MSWGLGRSPSAKEMPAKTAHWEADWFGFHQELGKSLERLANMLASSASARGPMPSGRTHVIALLLAAATVALAAAAYSPVTPSSPSTQPSRGHDYPVQPV